MLRWKVLGKFGGLLCVVIASTEAVAIEKAKGRGHKPYGAILF